MSSFVVETDHIDYLVSAVLRYAPDRMNGRTPDELGHLMLAENIATCTYRVVGVDGGLATYDDDWLEGLELEEVLEARAEFDAILAGYRFRPVTQLDPAQAAWVAACWQYQRTREGPWDMPETWAIADAVISASLREAPAEAFRDAGAPRVIDNLVTEGLRWGWSRT